MQTQWLTRFRWGAWFCVALIAYLSLIPAEMEVRTGLNGDLEHAFAYACTAIAFGLGYPERRLLHAIGLASYGCVLEMLQTFSPGRTPYILDAIASGSGALIGVAIAASIESYLVPKADARR